MPISALAHFIQHYSIHNTPLLAAILRIKSASIIRRISPYLIGKKILDVGTGIGGIHHHLQSLGYQVTGLDVHNVSAFPTIQPVLYNGSHFPFTHNQFDTGVIIHVLHHCTEGVVVLEEAMRTCKRVVVIEDTYRNPFEHAIVSFNDSLGNGEWYHHPYHQTSWWIHLIQKKGWRLLYHNEYSEFTYKLLYGRYVLFVIEK